MQHNSLNLPKTIIPVGHYTITIPARQRLKSPSSLMPRQARLDAPNLLQHVVARGIEDRRIFVDETDYTSFMERLALILEETQTKCYAWALLPDHFHLLLRTGKTPLSKVMRRFMTGYAVSYNKRYARNGHLFQNRYKSFVCEEELYLLELTRHIHLNPIRAGIVDTLNQLDRYAWTGHSTLLGKRKNPLMSLLPECYQEHCCLAEKTKDEFLLLFAEECQMARRKYRQYVKRALAGNDSARSNNIRGAAAIDHTRGARHAKRDRRILGSPNFTAYVLEEANKADKEDCNAKGSLNTLIDSICSHMDIDRQLLTSTRKGGKISYSRAVISYLASVDLGYTYTEIAKTLRLSSKSVGQCAEKGRQIAEQRKDIRKFIKSNNEYLKN